MRTGEIVLLHIKGKGFEVEFLTFTNDPDWVYVRSERMIREGRRLYVPIYDLSRIGRNMLTEQTLTLKRET